jgi:glycosyltransferase involved in cell wall biosynthesis
MGLSGVKVGWRLTPTKRNLAINVLTSICLIFRIWLDFPPSKLSPSFADADDFSGALIPRKAVDLVARAFKRLCEERDDVELQLIGAGEMDAELRTLLAPLGDRVSFVGFVDWRDLPTYYQNADVLCVPSRYDGWGLVVPEGLAAGLPVISSTQTGAAVEFIRHRINGWLVEPNAELPILIAMREAASLDPNAFNAMGQAAIDSVANHSLEHGAMRFQSAVEEAIREQ